MNLDKRSMNKISCKFRRTTAEKNMRILSIGLGENRKYCQLVVKETANCEWIQEINREFCQTIAECNCKFHQTIAGKRLKIA